MIRDTLQHIASNYLQAKQEAFAGHDLGWRIRHGAPSVIRTALRQADLRVKGSYGQFSQWAHVPWIAVFDPLITTGAERGYYIVYLFAKDMNRVFLSLNQGATEVEREFGAGAPAELTRRAALMRARLADYAKEFPIEVIDLGSSGLSALYEAGHALGLAYETSALPDESILLQDLLRLTTAYRQLTARGGLQTLEDEALADSDSGAKSLIEKRRYRYHRRIERNPKAAKAAKAFHGYRCQVCSFDFGVNYGALGAEYIEAHHLIPLSTLPEGEAVAQDPKTDFAVVCANCHRMLHRKDAPSLADLRAIPTVTALRNKNDT